MPSSVKSPSKLSKSFGVLSLSRRNDFLKRFKSVYKANQVAMWSLLDSSGTIAYDLSGNNLNAAYVSLPNLCSVPIFGRRGPLFDGVGYVNLYSSSFNTLFPRTRGTIFIVANNASGWNSEAASRTLIRFYTDGSNDLHIFKNGPTGGLYINRKAGGSSHLAAISAATMNGKGDFPIAIVYDSVSPHIGIFLDGSLVYESSTNVFAHLGNIVSSICHIAKPNAGYSWRTTAAFCGIWNTPLPTQEVMALSKKVSSTPVSYEGGFSFVIIPDTQSYSAFSPFRFSRQTSWIVDNASKYNIVGVVHSGDVVDDSSISQQWTNANSAMLNLDNANIPYIVSIGSHDWDSGGGKNSSIFNTHFSQSRYEAHDWWNGVFKDSGKTENAYYRLTVAGINFLILSIEEFPSTNVVTWANSVISENPNSRVIISTHAYLETDGSILPEAEYLWTNLFSLHDNILFVQCGHRVLPIEGSARRVDLNVNGKPVHQILSDFQLVGNVANTGLGHFRLMTILPEANKMIVQTYSPTEFSLKTDANNFFEIELDL